MYIDRGNIETNSGNLWCNEKIEETRHDARIFEMRSWCIGTRRIIHIDYQRRLGGGVEGEYGGEPIHIRPLQIFKLNTILRNCS